MYNKKCNRLFCVDNITYIVSVRLVNRGSDSDISIKIVCLVVFVLWTLADIKPLSKNHWSHIKGMRPLILEHVINRVDV